MPFMDFPLEKLRDYQSPDPEPKDFDAFWQASLAEAAQIPLDARFTPYDAQLALVDVEDVQFAGFGGHPIKGWLIKPKGAKGKLPVVIKYMYYGGGRGFPHEHLLWPATGRALFVMDTRGQGSGGARGDTGDPVGSGPDLGGFLTKGISDKHDYFYRRVFIDAVRAVQMVRERPDVDTDKITIAGGSQGGGITLAVAGLVPGLAAVMPDPMPFPPRRRGSPGWPLP